ncbi:MAG: ATP-binding protein [Clostridiales bacterium]|jgi:AAA+ ATPase superfamily predicted ATPase|nr:ATP-binding protein [Clostridiales bacterium]
MFLGRKEELKRLNEMHESDKFEMAIVYGRRRVGKSELIKKFCEGKRAVYFTAIESASGYNLSALINSIYALSGVAAAKTSLPNTFEQVFELLHSLSKRERLVFVIDEYPYLAKANKAVSSLLQKYIDDYFKDGQLFIILSGSSMSFMENQVLGYKSPLYGRRTAQFKILPFHYDEAALFVPNYSKADRLLTYGIFGGTPYYLAQIDGNKSLKENVKRLFFSTNGLLFEEPKNLIQQELREPQRYNSIITAIADGATKISEIANKVNQPANACDIYIKNLISLGLVYKEKPAGDGKSTRSLYLLSENMFKFWFRYVQKNISLIEQNVTDALVEEIFGTINEYMGHIFEDVCKQYLWNHIETLPITPKEIGRWWGNNPLTKSEEEIDLIVLGRDTAVFCECKFQNEKTDIRVLESLEKKSEMFHKYTEKLYYYFSKSGFTSAVIERAKGDGSVKMITIEEIIADRVES